MVKAILFLYSTIKKELVAYLRYFYWYKYLLLETCYNIKHMLIKISNINVFYEAIYNKLFKIERIKD